MNVPKFNEREKALEDEYIRRKEALSLTQPPVHIATSTGQSPPPTLLASILRVYDVLTNIMLRHLGKSSIYTQYKLIVAILLILIFTLLPKTNVSSTRPELLFTAPPEPREAAANATLGFHKLLTLSSKPSWRTRGLLAAAKLTELDFTIPPQPRNPEDFVVAFENIGRDQGKTPKHGSATAWIAHLDLLKFVIASNFETGLIVEDDVDWDVRIKDQVKLISDTVRNYTHVPDSDPTPYGTEWDILWLGHCGAGIDGVPPGQMYADDTRAPMDNYVSWSKDYIKDHFPEGQRQIQFSTQTVCTFGYGVTKASAQKILDLLARGADEASDVALSHRCMVRSLQCLVVNPEIMYHYEPSRDLGYVSPVDAGDGEGEAASEEAFEFIKGQTLNILESARCKALFDETCPCTNGCDAWEREGRSMM
ncbi:hypothetical protein H2200_003945 [Cladophialophora chaetospira]|uniref:Glycosyltransferase family 25 protein n=1 Tax=Cladophialophora chaetospira TaxID=386627 RepID=A0AA39CLK8_9EURO|nr:hypothetical protein H2200_003945 [Cladophialophora chaetospira]